MSSSQFSALSSRNSFGPLLLACFVARTARARGGRTCLALTSGWAEQSAHGRESHRPLVRAQVVRVAGDAVAVEAAAATQSWLGGSQSSKDLAAPLEAGRLRSLAHTHTHIRTHSHTHTYKQSDGQTDRQAGRRTHGRRNDERRLRPRACCFAGRPAAGRLSSVMGQLEARAVAVVGCTAFGRALIWRCRRRTTTTTTTTTRTTRGDG